MLLVRSKSLRINKDLELSINRRNTIEGLSRSLVGGQLREFILGNITFNFSRPFRLFILV